MSIKLIANIEYHANVGYTAWIESIKGMVVQGNSLDEVCKELFISLKVKLAFNLGINASEIIEISSEEALAIQRQMDFQHNNETEVCKKEINLTLS